MTYESWDNSDNLLHSPRERKARQKLNLACQIKSNLGKIERLGWKVNWLSARKMTFSLDWDKKVVRFPYPKDRRGLACMALAIDTINKTYPGMAMTPYYPRAWHAVPWSQSTSHTHAQFNAYERSEFKAGRYSVQYSETNNVGQYRSGLWRVHLRHWHMPKRYDYGACLKGSSPMWAPLFRQQCHMLLKWMQRREAWEFRIRRTATHNQLRRFWQAAIYRQRLLLLLGMKPSDYPLSAPALRFIKQLSAVAG